VKHTKDLTKDDLIDLIELDNFEKVIKEKGRTSYFSSRRSRISYWNSELRKIRKKLPENVSIEDVPTLEEIINVQKKLAALESYDYSTNDKLYQSDPERRHLNRLKKLKEFLLTGQKIKLDYADTSGLILINDKYIASLSSRSWRVKGKNKWYLYSTPQQLVDKYILRKKYETH